MRSFEIEISWGLHTLQKYPPVVLQSPYSLPGTGRTSLTPLRQSYQSFTRTVSFFSLSGSRREIAARGGIGSLLFLPLSFHVVFDPFVPLVSIVISAPALAPSAVCEAVGESGVAFLILPQLFSSYTHLVFLSPHSSFLFGHAY